MSLFSDFLYSLYLCWIQTPGSLKLIKFRSILPPQITHFLFKSHVTTVISAAGDGVAKTHAKIYQSVPEITIFNQILFQSSV